MIVRGPKPANGYYVLSNEIARDDSLSWAARGLLIRLLTCDDGWQVSPAALVKETALARTKSGRDAVYALLKELEGVGYLTKVQARTKGGKLGAVDYIVSEVKAAKTADVCEESSSGGHDTEDVPPLPAQPDTANPTQRSTKTSRSTNSKNSYSVGAHRKEADEQSSKTARFRSKAKTRKRPEDSDHPIYGRQLAKLVAEGVSERRARSCLASLLKVADEAEAIEMLDAHRSGGAEGADLIDVVMTYVHGEIQ